MRTCLELEGKLGLNPQSPSVQFRPFQPDTNPNARKGSKVMEKLMKMVPTKRFKAKIAAKPNSDEATVQPPTTVSKAPTDLENQTPSLEELQKTHPHL